MPGAAAKAGRSQQFADIGACLRRRHDAGANLQRQHRPDEPHREGEHADAGERQRTCSQRTEGSHACRETGEQHHDHRLTRGRSIAFNVFVRLRAQQRSANDAAEEDTHGQLISRK
jgi:hypothetical protein